LSQKVTIQQFEPPGPIGAAYIDSTHPIPIIMGPAGSGKTVASAYKGPHLATNWFPVCKDGVVRVKVTVLRPTYRDMARTALESWHSERLFPENHPWTYDYTGGIDRPVIHKLRWKAKRGPDLVTVDLNVMFAAIGDAAPEQFAKGFETSAVWLNECDLFGGRIPGLMFSRTGRYPSMDMIAPSELDRVTRDYRAAMVKAGLPMEGDDVLLPRILWGDCNPPDPSNWVNKWLIEKPDEHKLYKLFRQPSGLSAQAENRKGKPRSAYEMELQTMTPPRWANGAGQWTRTGPARGRLAIPRSQKACPCAGWTTTPTPMRGTRAAASVWLSAGIGSRPKKQRVKAHPRKTACA
jgi:hypothetical protein